MTEQTTNQDETVDAEPSAAEASDPGSDGAVDPEPETGGDRSSGGAGEDSGEGAEAFESGHDGAPSTGARVEEAADESDAERPSSEGESTADTGDLRAEFDALNDRHLRLVAEFNNFRRRSEQERMSAWTRAQGDLVGKLLDVLDDLQRVADLDLSNASVEAIMEGIDLVERKFMRQLQEAGVEMVDPEGEAFDPERMEAMMRVPAETDEQVDTVAQVFQKGYSLKGTLVRPARVSVYTQG